ncbi:MAG: DMT family transporter [Acidobacteria bacterium]|nr:DMT family transporter [Acidobacteriota bacterium]
MSGHGLLYPLIALMMLLWSANFIIAKVAVREIPPLLLSALRVALAGLFILPIYRWSRRNGQTWAKGDLRLLVALGVFGVALNQVFFVAGISRTSVAHSALLIGITPLMVLLIAAATGQERLSARKILGMLIALAGVAILNISPAPAGAGGATLAGDLLTLLATLTFALFTVLGKEVTERCGTIAVNTVAYTGGALALSPVVVWNAGSFAFAEVSWSAWASLLYMALFPSVVCYLIYFHALSRIPASRVAAFSYLQPLIATLMGVVLLGERISIPLAAGGSVIFAGVYLTERG